MTWIQTYTGKRFDLLRPEPSMVDLRDVAHALAHLCRFTGHTRHHYSVAQHSWLVAEYVATVMGRPDLGLLALLHDAAEAYTGDRSRPMKEAVREHDGGFDPFDGIADEIDTAVRRALAPGRHYTDAAHTVIKHADLVMLATEKRDLFDHCTGEWSTTEGNAARTPLPAPWDRHIGGGSAHYAFETFLDKYARHARLAGVRP